ncbi:Cytochrome P450 2U1 [Orchesella cincta]|uniref:Cytochrome P450 2U1 n=1 Tax=Orchesella cincta TaxID=48709 RepID=A0A1D2M162_ORCCI|nr:Cytochrome P450 2U1 [Orchesella cincta]
MDQVVGSCRQISLTDKILLPYTEAVLLEALRLSSIVPLGLPHRMNEDTIFRGYFLHKNATVISNLWAIHHDPKIWGEDVNEYRPERFLSEDKTRVVRHDSLMPFSADRRQCIGKGLARYTMFLFLANILLKFNIEKEPGCPVMKIEAPIGLLAESRPFNFVLNLRNSKNLVNKKESTLSIQYGCPLRFKISEGAVLPPKLNWKRFNPVLYVFGGGNGIINAQGHVWETQRNFTLRKLRDVGVFKSSIEEFLQEEASSLIKYFELRAGETIPGTKLFNGPVYNALWKIISGESIDWTSPIKPEILKRAENLTESMNQTVLSGLFFAPFLRHIAPGFFGWTSWVNSVKNFFAVTDQAIEAHSET